MDLAKFIATLKDLANVGFFVVVAWVTVLSYRRARETLFTPLRAEVFKLQLKEIGDAYTTLRGWLAERDNAFGFQDSFQINANHLFDAYVAHAFKLRRPEEEREAENRNSAGAVVDMSYLEPVGPTATKREAKPLVWSEYRHAAVVYTKQFRESIEQLTHLIDSPFLPAELTEILRELRGLVNKKLVAIRKVLDEASQELPTHYPDVASTREMNSDWIWNKFNEEYERRDVDAIERAIRFISSYLATSDLTRGFRGPGRGGDP